jgi:tRNA(fMet)-specific endonuclease VapC
MKQRYLLDTNILSTLVRHPGGKVAERIAEVGEETVFTSIIVAAGLRFGAAKKGSHRLAAQVEKILSALVVLPIEPPADHHYAELRLYLEKTGQTIGPNDMLIAAHALSTNATLVTANQREFTRIPDLTVEDWV